jgi:hypothetical protein
MKTYIYSILIWSCLFCRLNAQTDIVGYEKYDSYEQCIYIDNMDQRLIPDIFNDTYYYKIEKSEFNIVSQVIDTIYKKRYICVYSKKTKDGYLSMNTQIMNKVKTLDCDLNKLKISYLYNNKVVSTKDDVYQIIRLKKRNIQISSILYNNKLNIINIYIYIYI